MVNIEQQGLARTIFKPSSARAIVILAHGAGAGNQHAFMTLAAEGLAEAGIEVVSINFPYMQTAYELEKKRPPNTNKQLVSHIEGELEQLSDRNLPIFLAGKSMGGRISTQLAADEALKDKVKGVFVYGYPFIPPGKPEKYQQRVEHFVNLQVPLLICQGERDTFGNQNLLEQKTLPSSVQLSWITSGDHSFKPLKSTGLTEETNIHTATKLAVEFIDSLI